jgi:hypothetical protein
MWLAHYTRVWEGVPGLLHMWCFDMWCWLLLDCARLTAEPPRTRPLRRRSFLPHLRFLADRSLSLL